MKRILVTGATGFVGSYVIEELLNRGYTVIASSPDKNKAITKSWFKQVRYIGLDFKLIDPKMNYFDYFQKPDILIHLAWEGLPNYKAEFHLKENLPRHVVFLKNLISNGLRDLTITGTCFEYGTKEGCLNEEMEAAPTNFYAIAKNELRIEIEQFCKEQKASFKWARLFYMYGKGQNPKSLISQLEKALENNEKEFNMSGGEQVRDFLPIEKVAEFIVNIAVQKDVTGIINCCSGIPVTVKEFIKTYLKTNNKTITLNLGYYPYPDYEPMRFWGDNKKIKSIKQHE